MKYLAPYRVATSLLLLFCAGHTAGGMLEQKSLGLAADTVFEQMKAVHFTFNGADCTWYGFWFAFGLTASAFLLLIAVVSWRLAGVGRESWPVVAPIAWALVAAMAFDAVMSWKYFFAGPGVLSTLITLLLAVGAWSKGRSRPARWGNVSLPS